MDRMRADSYALVMSTVLRGRHALRLCPINPLTTEAEIEETIVRLGRFSADASSRVLEHS